MIRMIIFRAALTISIRLAHFQEANLALKRTIDEMEVLEKFGVVDAVGEDSMLRGHMLFDDKKFDQAVVAYEHALAQPNVQANVQRTS
jgi:hypothetical protein